MEQPSRFQDTSCQLKSLWLELIDRVPLYTLPLDLSASAESLTELQVSGHFGCLIPDLTAHLATQQTLRNLKILVLEDRLLLLNRQSCHMLSALFAKVPRLEKLTLTLNAVSGFADFANAVKANLKHLRLLVLKENDKRLVSHFLTSLVNYPTAMEEIARSFGNGWNSLLKDRVSTFWKQRGKS
jgi:hypothetical protein